MAQEIVGADLLKKLNSDLKGASPTSYYKHVQASLLSWDGDSVNSRKYHEEGLSLGNVFAKFGYEIDEFRIPLKGSQLLLESHILSKVAAASARRSEGTGKSLLILHYGGHGFETKDCRAVWAAEPIGDGEQPLVEWHIIQNHLEKSEADILLILDCCFGASAGRAGSRLGRIELISATAKFEKTPPPGLYSFTNAVINVLKQSLDNISQTDREDITAETLHRRLLRKEANLPATASHVVLRAGIPNRSIRLYPLHLQQNIAQQLDTKGPLIKLLIKTSSLDHNKIDELAIWLRSDIPSDVSLEVESITGIMGSLQSLITSFPDTDKPVGRALSEDSLSRIVTAWNNICELVVLYGHGRQQFPRTQSLLRVLESQARRFLSRLEEEETDLLESVEQGILHSPYAESQKGVDHLLETPEIGALPIANQLRLLQLTLRPEEDNVDEPEHSTKSLHDERHIWKEEKGYKQSLDQEELMQIEQRVRRIANLMEATKSEKFHALECIRWSHDDKEHRFILEFQVPPTHNPTRYWSLKGILAEGTKKRPTLGQRFRLAYTIAEAVLHWHSVQWVHQSITSHNIIFFEDLQSKIDFGNCFLQRFDYARPKQEPSIGRHVDDIQYNVYRHPDRQGPCRQGHTKIHDIYSLGVVLLEIGLWEDVRITGMKKDNDIMVDKMVRNLQYAAEKRLPHYMGEDYQEAVLACLKSECEPEIDDKAQSRLAESFQRLVMDRLRKNRDLR
ncbi:uncharacterized protein F4822DRAFT_217836 [Hypoxylon trugodes]|uniref:uncharacterized protein n=1 Tax=Hypoxylon trugodes TaxID=326681 RepID=UPI0021A2021E|nr:uncharacterized protein F4822DRAFT_217836 [Hypoxylon trugodes]KAI1389903.1 hypothetical protein F4822DRAFT_217836 [Hypoxylon trugodes]